MTGLDHKSVASVGLQNVIFVTQFESELITTGCNVTVVGFHAIGSLCFPFAFFILFLFFIICDVKVFASLNTDSFSPKHRNIPV